MSAPSLRRQARRAALVIAALAVLIVATALIGLIHEPGGGSASIAMAIIVLAGIALAAVSLLAFREINSVLILINRGQAAAVEAARGNLNTRVIRIGRTDELGALLNALNHILDLAEEFAKDTGAAMKFAGEGKYFRFIPTQGLRGDYQGFAQLANKVLADLEARDNDTSLFETSVQDMVSEVSKATQGITATAQTMAARSESAGGRSLDVGQAAEVTTELAASVSEATRHLASAINEIASQVAQSAQIAQSAVGDISQTVDRMTGLGESVTRIGDVVNLIHDIASQTNLLALNATIEAARAGEAGKGFVVVANEVKSLANQTARATEDITKQVAAVRAAAGAAANGVAGVVETIHCLDEISAAIAGAVQEQEAVTRDISAHIEEVAAKSALVSENVAHLSKASAQSCGGTVRVIWSAQTLSGIVDALHNRVSEYIRSVR